MKDGLVSIIMPSWNTARFIEESIKSVLAQTYKNWELLIVDDCSTDDTDEKVKPFTADERVKYFKLEQNGGAALARNFALRKAEGEWIAFLDSDDLWRTPNLSAFMFPGRKRLRKAKCIVTAIPVVSRLCTARSSSGKFR